MTRGTVRARPDRGPLIVVLLLLAVPVVLLSLAVAGRAGLIGYQRPDEVRVGQDDLIGTWRDGNGMTLRLAADHSATVDGRRSERPCLRDGFWAFYVPTGPDSAVSDSTATAGSEAIVNFHRNLGDRPSGCPIDLSVFRIHGEYVLCTEDDPDSYCPDEELLHRITGPVPTGTPTARPGG